VASTDGPIGPRQEHILLPEQVGVPALVVFLNKTDMVDEPRRNPLSSSNWRCAELLETAMTSPVMTSRRDSRSASRPLSSDSRRRQRSARWRTSGSHKILDS